MSYAATDGTSDRTDWWLCSQRMPAEGEPVRTKIDDESGLRENGILERKGDVWFHIQGGNKTCWTPTHWHALSDKERKEFEQDAFDQAIVWAARPMYEACLEVAANLLDELRTGDERFNCRIHAMRAKLHGATPDRTRKAVPDGS